MHVGKIIPRTQLWPIFLGNAGSAVSYPPRFLKFTQLPTTPIGSVPLQWDDLIVVSEEAAELPGGVPGWRFVFINPNNNDLTLVMDTEVEEWSPADPNASHYRLKIETSFYDGTDQLTNHTGTDLLPLLWGTASWGGRITSASPGVDPAVWTELRWTVRCAVWADVPWYHPYRV